MSKLSIASYFPFRRIKIVKQTVTPEATGTHIQVQPDKRFQPICHGCGQKASGVHSWTQRKIRDLNLANACSWITCRYRKVFCARCQGIHIEDLELFHPYLRVTDRLALYVYQLCRVMTVSEVAQHLAVDWKTVKTLHLKFTRLSPTNREKSPKINNDTELEQNRLFYGRRHKQFDVLE